jgi:hypothetical protein
MITFLFKIFKLLAIGFFRTADIIITKLPYLSSFHAFILTFYYSFKAYEQQYHWLFVKVEKIFNNKVGWLVILLFILFIVKKIGGFIVRIFGSPTNLLIFFTWILIFISIAFNLFTIFHYSLASFLSDFGLPDFSSAFLSESINSSSDSLGTASNSSSHKEKELNAMRHIYNLEMSRLNDAVFALNKISNDLIQTLEVINKSFVIRGDKVVHEYFHDEVIQQELEANGSLEPLKKFVISETKKEITKLREAMSYINDKFK